MTEQHKQRLRDAWKKRRLTPFSLETRTRMSRAHLAEKNNWWKGDAVGYSGIHKWIKKYYGSADRCENCPIEFKQGVYFEWANLSGLYKREREDWKMMCRKCHREHDKTRGPAPRLMKRVRHELIPAQ